MTTETKTESYRVVEMSDESYDLVAESCYVNGKRYYADIAARDIADRKTAELFAAAPELLAALARAQMAMLGYTHRNQIIQDALDSCAAALAKAKGE